MQLNIREKYFIASGIIFLLMLTFVLGFRAIRGKYRSMDETIIELQQTTGKLERMGQLYLKYKSMKIVNMNQKLDNMVPYLEESLDQTGLKDKANIQPNRQSLENKIMKKSVRINIIKSDARKVLLFIQQIENSTSNIYKIDSFLSRPVFQGNGLYNFTIEIIGYEKASEN